MPPHDTTSHRFYVYILARPNQKPFYVGKGKGKRVYDHEGEARSGHACHKCKVIRKIWRNGGEVQRYIVFTTDDEQEAYQYEKDLIALHGRENLANETDGGEGQSGRKGELCGMAKLTRAQVDEIRRRYATETTPIKAIAADYGVSVANIEKIVSQETWHKDPTMPTRRDQKIRLQNTVRGEQVTISKLTWEQVHEIREKYADGSLPWEEIARIYGVGRSVIGSVLHNKTWHDPSYDPSVYTPCTNRASGELNRGAKLTWEDVRAIRARYIPHEVTIPMLAVEYGVGRSCIMKIVSGRTWRE